MQKLNTTTFDRNFKKLLDEEEEIEEQLSKIQGRLAELQKKITAYRLVSEECADIPVKNEMVGPDEVRHMSLRDALVTLAERHNGELNVYQSRPLLRDAGLLRGEPRTVSSRLHDALVSSKRFEQTGERGRWRLIGESEAISVSQQKAENSRKSLRTGFFPESEAISDNQQEAGLGIAADEKISRTRLIRSKLRRTDASASAAPSPEARST